MASIGISNISICKTEKVESSFLEVKLEEEKELFSRNKKYWYPIFSLCKTGKGEFNFRDIKLEEEKNLIFR